MEKGFFEAIQITDNGIHTDRIKDNEFINGRFIPKNNIELIKANTITKI